MFWDVIFKLIYWVLSLLSPLVTLLCLAEIFGFARLESNFGPLCIPLVFISLIGVFITNVAVHQFVGIHDLELKPSGTYCFYVEAQREGGKTYVLPAEVEVVKENKEDGGTMYFIKAVYFSNGGRLDTDNGYDCEIGKPINYYDSDDDVDWTLTLLNEHAYSPYVEETNTAHWLTITFLVVGVLAHVLALRIFYIAKRETAA